APLARGRLRRRGHDPRRRPERGARVRTRRRPGRGGAGSRLTVRVLVVVAATERELAFVRGAETFCCGVGPVDAAARTAAELARRRPAAVLHIGLAGARGLEPPALVLGSESVYSDVIDSGSSFPRVERLEPDAALLAAARAALPEAHVLPIGTSGRVGGGGAARLHVDALRRILEEQGQRAAEGDEDLFLALVDVPAAARVGGVAPHSRARLCQPDCVGDGRLAARLGAVDRLALLPGEL